MFLMVFSCEGFLEGGESPSSPSINLVGSKLIVSSFSDDSLVFGLGSQPRASVTLSCLSYYSFEGCGFPMCPLSTKMMPPRQCVH